MAKGVYFGVGGVARKVKSAYIGIGGKARKIKKMYIGIGGVARLFYSALTEKFIKKSVTGLTGGYGTVSYEWNTIDFGLTTEQMSNVYALSINGTYTVGADYVGEIYGGSLDTGVISIDDHMNNTTWDDGGYNKFVYYPTTGKVSYYNLNSYSNLLGNLNATIFYYE